MAKKQKAVGMNSPEVGQPDLTLLADQGVGKRNMVPAPQGS